MRTAREFGKKIQQGAAALTIMLAFAAVGRANIKVSPSSVSFGNQAVGRTSASHTVTITNRNRGSVTISSVEASMAQFSFSGPSLPVKLEPGQSLTGSVTFTPSAAQAYSGELQFTRANRSTISVALSGTGTDPANTSSSTVVPPSITSQPASLTIITGQTATFNVAATGTSPLTFQWKKNGTAVAGATSSTFTTPAETMADNNAQFSADVSNSGGKATSNAATLTVTAPTLLLNSSASSIGFGNVNVSSTGTQTVTLTNAGNSTVTISNVTVSGAGFNASGVSSGLMLTPGQTATLTATFTPAAAGGAKGSVSVGSNASNSPDSISLSGTGVAVVTHSVLLSWTASVSNVVGYNAYSSQVSGGPYTRMNPSPVAGTSYTDSNVTAGQTYFFVVTSVNSSNVESADSAETSAVVP